jgi:hypothetical protein
VIRFADRARRVVMRAGLMRFPRTIALLLGLTPAGARDPARSVFDNDDSDAHCGAEARMQ